MTAAQALAFVRKHGVVLQAAHGPVPTLVEAIAGEPIRKSWWGHPKGRHIFRVLAAVCDSDEVMICRLIGGKVTYVHRRLWPALARLAGELNPDHLAAIREEHTASGAHRVVTTPLDRWLPAETRRAARQLSLSEARA